MLTSSAKPLVLAMTACQVSETSVALELDTTATTFDLLYTIVNTSPALYEVTLLRQVHLWPETSHTSTLNGRAAGNMTVGAEGVWLTS